MSKFFKVLCVVALALCVTASVYAETQSVKVSGDLAIRGIHRGDYDYRGSISESTTTPGTRDLAGTSATQDFWMSTAEVQIDADLTDNVQTVVRLVNQRDWNVVHNKQVASNTTLAMNGFGGYTPNSDEFDVMLDLAYVQLKNFIYSPLTVTIGRQDLWFGKGFIIGLNQQNPGNDTGAGYLTPTQLSAPEYTAINSFDAIKAVLDFDPWTITAIYSNTFSGAIAANDGTNLWGVNVGYKFNNYNAEAEGYWFFKKDKKIETWGNLKDNSDDTHTIGIRGSMDPMDTLTIFGEGAIQVGTYIGSRLQEASRARLAAALDLGLEWRYFTDKFAWKPKVGLEYVLYSGHQVESNTAQASGIYTGWNPMYRGKFDSAIREFVGRYYASYEYPVQGDVMPSCTDASFTNQNQLIVRGSLQPMESLTLSGNYNIFWTATNYQSSPRLIPPPGEQNVDGLIGQEVDLQANWDYTEDVSFGVLAAWFMPGNVYKIADKVATDFVGTVTVDF